ncbi:MAG: glycosyl hydrolase [Novosphingobium sp.]
MKAAGTTGTLRAALLLATSLVPTNAFAEQAAAPAAQPSLGDQPTLEDQFANPPQSARPRVWWHWMNGNITKDGIAKDLAWMKRVGIGGLQNFDASLMTPQIVDKRLVYMTPEWKDAFKFTAEEADRHGLELAIAASPGWSETGGPWVKPEDGLKKLVWSETTLKGGKRFNGKLESPPQTTGPFQTLHPAGGIEDMLGATEKKAPPQHYGDVKVLAFPVPAASLLTPVAVSDGKGKTLVPAGLADAELSTGVDIDRDASGKSNPTLVLDYGKPVTVRSLAMFAPGAAMMFAGALYNPVLEASDTGTDWRKVTEFETAQTTATFSFAPVTARYFRVEFLPRKGVGLAMGAAAPGVAMDFDIAKTMGASFMSKPLTVGEFRLFGDPRIDHAETKAGFSISQNYYDLPTPADGATGVTPASVIDLTGRMQADGTLDWTPPKGSDWRVLRLGHSLLGTTNHPAPPEATGLEVDKFDGDAVKRYLDHYIGMYRDASGGMIGKRGVQAILTDSIEVGAANWTPKMIEQFKRLRGYDPTPWMPALTGVLVGSRADSDRFLYDYRRTLADLMASEHYGTVARVAHEAGLKVYGEALEDHRPSLGDDMSMRSHADIPMAAMWTHSRAEGPKLTYLADIKGAASVAHIYGQNLVAAESMTASMNPWYYAPRDLKRVIDLEFVTGVNRPVVHTSVHVPLDDKKPGLSLFIFGQYFNRNESWAEMAKPWVDYMARNALMLQQGRNVADVAYFYGEEAPLTGLYGDKRVADAPSTRAYDFVNFDALASALSNDGADLVTPGGARYKALYLGGSSHRMTLAALKRVAQLAEGGATIVGQKPEGSPSLSGDAAEYAALLNKLWGGNGQVGKGRVIASSDIEAALTQIGVGPDFTADGAPMSFLHRKLADGDSYFLTNASAEPRNVEARFRVTGKQPELWRAETGKSEPVSYRVENGMTVVPLSFEADGAVHVVFRKDTTATSATLAAPAFAQAANLDDTWTVTFQPGRGAPASATFAKLEALEKNADPAIKYFSGEATYARDFTTPKGWKSGLPLWLDLGDVRELAEVSINGQPAGAVWHPPYRLDIGGAVKPGRNKLAVKVANLWVNRLIGDQQPGATKLTWTAMPTYKADAPLRPSGLIGPVKLLGSAK